MTVKELIEILKTMPQEYDVTIYDSFEGMLNYNFEVIKCDSSKQIEIYS